MRTRGRKILGDIMARKGRTALVVVSIMIGVWGVATMLGVTDMITSQLDEDLKPENIAMTHVYVATASATSGEQISLADNQTFVETLKQLPGITDVEGQAIYPVSWKKAGAADDADYENTFVISYTEPFGEVDLEPISRVVEGRYPEPGKNEIVVEKRLADKYNLKIGDKLKFRQIGNTPGAEHEWEISGIVFHPYLTLSLAAGDVLRGETMMYATYEDAQSFAGFPGLSSFYIRYDDSHTPEKELNTLMQTIATQTDYIPVFTFIDDPEESLLITQVGQVSNVLNILGIISMVVSGFLVTNVINTIIMEQKKQIGVMKSIGASWWDTVFIYTGMALVYGFFGTLLGILLSIPIAYLMAENLASLAWTMIDGFRISPVGVGAGIFMGLLVPVLAALIPVYNGTRVSIIKAMTDLGISSDWGKSFFSRLIGRLPVPLNIRQALSNVFQKKGRLALTGITLMLAVATFMGVTAVFTAMGNLTEDLFNTFNFEIVATPQEPQNIDTIRALIAQNMDNVEAVYPGYGVSIAIQGYESTDQMVAVRNQIEAIGIDTASPIIQFNLEDGTGWQDDPTRRGVILTRPLAKNLKKHAGEDITVIIGGQSYDFKIIGIDSFPFENIFFEWKELATMAGYMDESGQPMTDHFYLDLKGDPDLDTVAKAINNLSELMINNGIQAAYTNQVVIEEQQAQQMNAFTYIFNITSGVMAAVGAVGLLATLSMSVYERQKEIGVMRSIGAGSGVIISQFMVEGILVGVLSWLVAIPLSVALAYGLIDALPFDGDFTFHYPLFLIPAGLAGIIIIAGFASLWPSVSASRKTVSDILRYQ